MLKYTTLFGEKLYFHYMPSQEHNVICWTVMFSLFAFLLLIFKSLATRLTVHRLWEREGLIRYGIDLRWHPCRLRRQNGHWERERKHPIEMTLRHFLLTVSLSCPVTSVRRRDIVSAWLAGHSWETSTWTLWMRNEVVEIPMLDSLVSTVLHSRAYLTHLKQHF